MTEREDGEAGGRILVLGVGNLLWADDGFGVRAVEELTRLYEVPEQVRLLDGGTQGLYLMAEVRAAARLLILDAVDFGLPPGSLRQLADGDIPLAAGAGTVDVHQVSMHDLLGAAALFGDGPRNVVLIGVQPEKLDDFGGPMTAVVAAQIRPAVAAAVHQLAAWDAVPTPRRDPPPRITGLLPAAAAMAEPGHPCERPSPPSPPSPPP